jgi:PAS domain S-box-containing protein
MIAPHVSFADRRLHVLVVDDSEEDFATVVQQLRAAGYNVVAERVGDVVAFATALERPWELVLTESKLAGDTLAALTARELDAPCIVVAALADEAVVVEALHAGAADFVAKTRLDQLAVAVERAFAFAAERRKRVHAERELRLSEARYRTGFEVAPEALLTYDYVAMRIVDANPAAVALFGYSYDELRALAVGGLSAPVQSGKPAAEAIREIQQHVLNTAHTGGPFDWTYVTKSGTEVPCEIRMVQLPSADQTHTRLSILDLRPRQRVEELRRKAVELEGDNQRIAEANRLKSEFLANMSHELRTPLNAIIGFAELLHDGHVTTAAPQHHEFLGDILSSGRHLLQLINDLLDLAKVEAGKLELRPEPLDPGRVIRDVVAAQRPAATAKRLQITVDVDAELGTVHVDPARLRQVAWNLIGNAIKFTPEGGAIGVTVARETGDDSRAEFCFAVADTGPGIAAADLTRLFVEFEQLETGLAKRHQGTGLGLALVKRLVEAQGGTVGVTSAPSKGSTFYVTLPCAGRAVAPPARPLPDPVGAPMVLVIEAADGGPVAAALEHAGFAIDVATTGAAALAAARARGYAAIAIASPGRRGEEGPAGVRSDVGSGVPDMSVVQLAAAFRRRPETRDLPLVVVAVVAAELGADALGALDGYAVITSPLDAARLAAALARAGVRPDRPGGVLVVDDDPNALRLMNAALAQHGIQSITRSTGAAGLDAAARLKPAAIVVDLVMPGMDGHEFLEHLRRLPAHARTPVLVWTVKDLDDGERARLRESAQAIAAKADSPLGVVHQIRALLGGA